MNVRVSPGAFRPNVGSKRASAYRPITRIRRFFLRTPLRNLSIPRLLSGGRINDAGRLPRYVFISVLVLAGIWIPVISYVKFTPPSFQSSMSLILPGAGVSASVNLSDIGQASTSSSSAFSSSSISPTVTYQKLFQSGRVISRAAVAMGLKEQEFGQPRIKLIDQTSFMRIDMAGASPNQARDRAEALLEAFHVELEALRTDELVRREQSVTGTVSKYQDSVNEIRDRISALQLSSGLSSSGQYNKIVDTNEDLRLEIERKQADLEEARQAVASLERLIGIAPKTASATIKLHSDPEYTALLDAMSDAAAEAASLSQRFGPKHPELLVARKNFIGIRMRMLDRAMQVTGLSVEQLENQLERAAGGERGAMMAKLVEKAAERDGLEARLSALRQNHEANARRTNNLIKAASELESLNRDYKVAEAVFTSALARVNVSKTDIFASYPMVQVAEPPSLPWKPSSPNIKIALGAGIAASIFAIIGLVLGWMRRPLINKVVGAITGKPDPKDAAA